MSRRPLVSTRPSRLLGLATLATCSVLTLAACGSRNEPVAGPGATSPSATPSPPASSPPCPTTATEVKPPAGATADLKVKPVVAPNATAVPTGIQYADVVQGKGAEAVTGSQVKVKYVGAFYKTGKEFDSSWSRGPEETIPFGICQEGVIPGFAVGPTGMKVGGRRVITIPSAFAYGPQGRPPTIPADTALVFVVDLVEVS